MKEQHELKHSCRVSGSVSSELHSMRLPQMLNIGLSVVESFVVSLAFKCKRMQTNRNWLQNIAP